MATRDGLAQIWYADANGVITGNTPTADNVASAIIDGYNEHFGTGINIWTPETINLQVGGTVPNWNAYEKIYLPETKVKFNMPGSTTMFAMGKIVGSNFSLIGNNNNQFYKVETSGVINDLSDAASNFASSYCKQKLESAGYNVLTTNVEVKAYEVGDNVEDWQSYILVT